MGGFIFFISLILLTLIGVSIFGIILIYKSLQFTFTATSLYKKMISREEMIVQLLIDIRDNTKQFDADSYQEITSPKPSQKEMKKYCPKCDKYDCYEDANGNVFCPNCKTSVV